MKRSLVVYERAIDPVQAIAQAVADGASTRFPSGIVDTDHASPIIDPHLGLLVIGGPDARLALLGSRAVAPARVGTTGWIGSLAILSEGVFAAVFEVAPTRWQAPAVGDESDLATQEKFLFRVGFEIVAPAETFLVASAMGTLEPGEEERARRWGKLLAARAAMRLHNLACLQPRNVA